jgi:hypothetical protein
MLNSKNVWQSDAENKKLWKSNLLVTWKKYQWIYLFASFLH